MNKVAQIVLWTLTGLMALLLTAAALLYAPPVQDFLRRKVVAWTAEAIGLQVAVEHIGLRFPLKLRIQGASVLDSTRTKGVLDTLFYVRSFDVAIQARPLLRGRVEVDGIGLDNVRVNSAGLLEGMQVEGRLGHFFVAAHGIDLSREQAVLDCIELSDARVKVVLTDTTTSAEPDTTSTPLRWKITLKELCMRNVTADIRLPEDSIPLKGQLAELSLKQAEADLDRQRYAWQTFRLRDASFDYGLALRNLHAGIDSVYWQGKEFRARLTDLEMNERSGLSVTALTGYLQADSTGIRIPNLRLLTPHSEINLKADARPEWMENPERGGLNALLNARIGKQDVLLLMGKDLPEAFRRDYPFRPLHLQVGQPELPEKFGGPAAGRQGSHPGQYASGSRPGDASKHPIRPVGFRGRPRKPESGRPLRFDHRGIRGGALRQLATTASFPAGGQPVRTDPASQDTRTGYRLCFHPNPGKSSIGFK